MSYTLNQFACLCGAQAEGVGEPPPCWSCGGEMRQWATRSVEVAPAVLSGERADGRTENGGY